MGTELAIKESPLYDRFVVQEFDAETGIELTYNQKVDRLYLFLSEQPQCDLGVINRVSEGLYSREATAPSGTFLISKTHKKENQFVQTKGIIHMADEVGGVKRYEGHCHGVTKPGTRRVVYVEEEATFTTFYPTNKTDIKEIEAELYVEDELYVSTNPDIIDFVLALKDMDIDPERLRILVANKQVVPMPKGDGMDIEFRASTIHGTGTFATNAIKVGTRIAAMQVDAKRATPAGHYVNHGLNSNVISITGDDGMLALYAARDIAPGEELLSDYRQYFREALLAFSLRKPLN